MRTAVTFMEELPRLGAAMSPRTETDRTINQDSRTDILTRGESLEAGPITVHM